ncbi:GatB/YqeY domain-containing protein [Selenomonadales bacterium OttesenSCG-928-I06]|nr:GatB/YqeY domain-containing protein [Selenomonadales bacterium OttesenSCG-928-I06]
MSVQDLLLEDMKQAMRDKESGKLRLSVIRMVRASIKNIEIDKKKELSDEEVAEVLAKELKMRKASIEEFKKANRDDLVETLEQEIEILLKYIPEQMSEEEITLLVVDAIKEAAATNAKDMGKVMALLMPKVKGRADGKLVNNIVKEKLNA